MSVHRMWHQKNKATETYKKLRNAFCALQMDQWTCLDTHLKMAHTNCSYLTYELKFEQMFTKLIQKKKIYTYFITVIWSGVLNIIFVSNNLQVFVAVVHTCIYICHKQFTH